MFEIETEQGPPGIDGGVIVRSVDRSVGRPDAGQLLDQIAAQRQFAAAAQAELDRLCVEFVDLRIAELDAQLGPEPDRPPGARSTAQFAATELSVVLGKGSRETSCVLARARRIGTQLPKVQRAASAGVIDADRVKQIDRAARMVVHPETLTTLDEQVVAAAETSTTGQLTSWLDRFLARCEPNELTERRCRAHADRRVTAHTAVNGMGYVTGEVSAVDAAAIDARLSRMAWLLGAADPRTLQQRRSDLFSGLLLGQIDDRFGLSVADQGVAGQARASCGRGGVESDGPTKDAARTESVPSAGSAVAGSALPDGSSWLEVENVDPQTGEWLGSTWQLVDAAGDPLDPTGSPMGPAGRVRQTDVPPSARSHRKRRRGATALDRLPREGPQVHIGVVMSLESLTGASELPAQLWDRTGIVPAAAARELALRPGTLFSRLLTDPRGQLMDITEIGRFPSDRLGFAVRTRSGQCVFPTCERSAALCDVDHHQPVPTGPTTAPNLGPLCRPHHNAKTFAWLACRRAADQTIWTSETANSYRCTDPPLPLG